MMTDAQHNLHLAIDALSRENLPLARIYMHIAEKILSGEAA